LTQVAAFEVKRSGTPEVAPPGGQDSGAAAVLGGEEGDDLVKNGIGEGADVVYASSIFIVPRRHRSPPPGTRTTRLHFDLHGEPDRG
jgi:hypothetical protein